MAYRIPQLSQSMRAATIRAAERQQDDRSVRRLIERLERIGYRVTPQRRAA